jgi:hypothetical protein
MNGDVISNAANTSRTIANARERERMPRCGVCGSHYGELLLKHGETCEDDVKGPARPYGPEKTINDIKREEEESNV